MACCSRRTARELVYYLPTRADAAYTVPDGVVILRESAFTGNKMLTSVSLPASLTLIDTSAFNSCGALETVEFRKGGTELLVIGRLAFANTATTSVDLPARVASLGDWAFNRTSLSSITFAENSKLVTLGDSVFGSTKLNAVTLPAGIVSIGELTFARCENLMTVTLLRVSRRWVRRPSAAVPRWRRSTCLPAWRRSATEPLRIASP